jgi:hypothetical protein
MNSLELAILFHETYERLAPSFGYETRTDTRVFDPESKNGKLMVAVCGELLGVQHIDGDQAMLVWWKKNVAVMEDRIRELEAALHEIADFSEQFIADDDCMYKVNQIADTALAYAASGATTAASREGEPT